MLKSLFLLLSCSLVATECYPPGILPSAVPCQQTGFYFMGSFIYWQAKMGGLEYGAKEKDTITLAPPIVAFDTHIVTPDFAWNPGFKVLMGYNLSYDNWDTDLIYTYYKGRNSHIKKTILSAPFATGEGVVPLHFYEYFSGSSDSILYRKADGLWKMHFHTLDWELGRSYFVNHSLKMRLYGGLKGAWIKQTYTVDYTDSNVIDAGGPSAQFTQTSIQYKTHTGGIGPRGGMDSRWNVWRGWNILADASFSLVYSFFDIHRKQTDSVIFNGVPETLFANLKNEFSQFLPVLQLSLGTDWGTCFGSKCNPYFLLFAIIYETQFWWELNQMPRFVNSQASGQIYNVNGHLQMQGLTAKVQLDF